MRERANLVKFVQDEFCSFGRFTSITSTEQAEDESSNEEECLRDEMESTNTAENTTTTNSDDSFAAMIASMNQPDESDGGKYFLSGKCTKEATY